MGILVPDRRNLVSKIGNDANNCLINPRRFLSNTEKIRVLRVIRVQKNYYLCGGNRNKKRKQPW